MAGREEVLVSFCGCFPQSRLQGSDNNHPLLDCKWTHYRLLFAVFRTAFRLSNSPLKIPSGRRSRMQGPSVVEIFLRGDLRRSGVRV